MSKLLWVTIDTQFFSKVNIDEMSYTLIGDKLLLIFLMLFIPKNKCSDIKKYNLKLIFCHHKKLKNILYNFIIFNNFINFSS